jgi:hypothetical protein
MYTVVFNYVYKPWMTDRGRCIEATPQLSLDISIVKKRLEAIESFLTCGQYIASAIQGLYKSSVVMYIICCSRMDTACSLSCSPLEYVTEFCIFQGFHVCLSFVCTQWMGIEKHKIIEQSHDGIIFHPFIT